MQSLSQRLVRDLFENQMIDAANAVARAEEAMLKAHADLSVAIITVETAQQTSAPFVDGLSKIALNHALIMLQDAKQKLSTYTARIHPEPQPAIEA